MEGAPHTAKRTIDVSLGCPLHPYIKEEGRRPAGLEGRAMGGPTRTPSPSRIPLSFSLPSFHVLPISVYRGRTSPLGAGLSLSWPIRPI